MRKIEVLRTDITELECDAIVNAANSSLLGGGGVDGAIHRKAGPGLKKECSKLGGCTPGEAKITKGYNLKAKYVIHAVGPVWMNGEKDEVNVLGAAYRNSIDLASKNGIKTLAFPNISTGVYGFPKKEAARIAVSTAKKGLEKNQVSKIVFVCFDEENYNIYKSLLTDED